MNMNLNFDRAMMNGMYHELKALGFKAYKDAYIMKNTFGYWFHAPSLDFSCDIKANNAYQARYEGWRQYLDKKGLLNNFGAVECAYNADK